MRELSISGFDSIIPNQVYLKILKAKPSDEIFYEEGFENYIAKLMVVFKTKQYSRLKILDYLNEFLITNLSYTDSSNLSLIKPKDLDLESELLSMDTNLLDLFLDPENYQLVKNIAKTMDEIYNPAGDFLVLSLSKMPLETYFEIKESRPSFDEYLIISNTEDFNVPIIPDYNINIKFYNKNLPEKSLMSILLEQEVTQSDPLRIEADNLRYPEVKALINEIYNTFSYEGAFDLLRDVTENTLKANIKEFLNEINFYINSNNLPDNILIPGSEASN
jgi:hypothetical protein